MAHTIHEPWGRRSFWIGDDYPQVAAEVGSANFVRIETHDGAAVDCDLRENEGRLLSQRIQSMLHRAYERGANAKAQELRAVLGIKS